MTLYPGVAYGPPVRVATPYPPASGRDAGRPQPGTVGLLAYLIEQARAVAVDMGINPDTIRVRSMGIYNFRPTASGRPSVHGDGRAFDLGIAVTRNGHRVMVELLKRIGPNAHRVGFTYGIFARQQTRNGGWIAYGTRGDRLHDHWDHLHGEQSQTYAAIAAATMIATCRRVLGDWRRNDTGDDDMFCKRGDRGPAVGYLQLRLKALGADLGTWGDQKDGVDEVYGATVAEVVKTRLGGNGETFGARQAFRLQQLEQGRTSGLTQQQADARYLRPGPVNLAKA
jgi:hypothetical protein